MTIIWVILVLQTICISSNTATPMQDVYYEPLTSKEFISVAEPCDEDMVIRWSSDFHNCFMERKYKDGGQDLETIVYRILNHAEECVEESNKECRLNYEGFYKILMKVLEQMLDYSTMYLQDIRAGRDKIKNLQCVEETLSIAVFMDCFQDIPEAQNKTDYEFQQSVTKGISCTNDRNIDCSVEARATLNRIVRMLFNMEQPSEEEAMLEKEEPPPPKAWYDYVTEPFVNAWNAVRDFFSNLFG